MKNMFYGVNWLCAFDPASLQDASISRDLALESLQKMGFEFQTVDITKIARQCIGVSSYRQSALQGQAPEFVNCRTYLAWVYAQKGILVPALSLAKAGNAEVVDVDQMVSGDLVFVSDGKSPSGGHVGMATDRTKVIHAQSGVGVQEVSLRRFLKGEKLRRIVRVADNLPSIITVNCHPNSQIVCSSDFESIIRRSIG